MIACFSKNYQENETFVRLSRYFESRKVRVPHIIWVSHQNDFYLLEDLGDDVFLKFIHNRRNKGNFDEELKVIIKMLVTFQTLPEPEWQRLVEFPPIDSQLISNDFRYAVENFILVLWPEYPEEAINREFKVLENRLLGCPESMWGLMYRDFQSRNIMMHDGPVFIDYQSCRKGPGVYDLVSFAWQAKAGFTIEEREKIIDLYCDSMQRAGRNVSVAVKNNIPYWALFRILQTLGAYGLRGLKEGKPHFIESIPPALSNLQELIEHYQLKSEFPVLAETVAALKRKAK